MKRSPLVHYNFSTTQNALMDHFFFLVEALFSSGNR